MKLSVRAWGKFSGELLVFTKVTGKFPCLYLFTYFFLFRHTTFLINKLHLQE